MRGAYAINHVPTSGLFTSAYPDLSPKSESLATNGAANGGQVQMDFDPLVLPTGGLAIPSNGKFTNITNVNALYYLSSKVKTPYIQQWNFGLGFQFGSSMGMEVNYVGNKGTDIFGPSAIYNSINLQQYTQEFEAGMNMSQSIPNPQGILGANGQVINVTRQNSPVPACLVRRNIQLPTAPSPRASPCRRGRQPCWPPARPFRRLLPSAHPWPQRASRLPEHHRQEHNH